MDDKDFEAAFEAIRQKFLAKLAKLPVEFQQFKIHLQQDDVSAEQIDDIRMQMHKLAGSARTFGFSDLNNLAATAEDYLNKVVAGASLDAVRDDFLKALDLFLVEADKCLENVKPSGGATRITIEDQMSDDYLYHILTADDDELVRDLLKHGLKEAKCKIVPAANGKKVLELLENTKKHSILAVPDLIILDVNMPEMNGFEVLEALKKNPDTESIPVIMLTRCDEDENIIRGISQGAADYITKPFDTADLAKRVLNSIERNSTKVLIADDDEIIEDLLFQRFNRMGYSVIRAHNGEEALARAHKDSPDIVILDVMMPGIDGIAVLRQMKSNPKLKHIPVVMLTAKGQEDNVVNGLESGAHDYITKPFNLDELVARVSGILRRSKAA